MQLARVIHAVKILPCHVTSCVSECMLYTHVCAHEWVEPQGCKHHSN